jgi:nitroreductase
LFDQDHNFDHETVKRSLELAILSPNSSNLQTWEFYRYFYEEMRANLTRLHESAARTASEMVVFVSQIGISGSNTLRLNFDTY